MSIEIKIHYNSVEEAIAGLVRLHTKIEHYVIDSDLDQTKGQTREEIDNVLSELRSIKGSIGLLVWHTRQALKETSDAFKDADEKAQKLINTFTSYSRELEDGKNDK